MLFPTAVFALFFFIVFSLYWGSAKYPLTRKWVVLFSSLVFYGYWSWKFALMLLASALVNHFAAVAIARLDNSTGRRRILVCTVAANLFVLAIFKYTRFLFSNVFVPLAIPLSNLFGTPDSTMQLIEQTMPFISRIILPVGISFYTFQALSYVIDVYRGNIKPAATALDFANYLAFFPQLVAGPIVRAVDLLPQMEALPHRGITINTGRAACLILVGLFKKIVVANWLAGHLADEIFESPEFYGGLDILLGVYAYAIQIYCDFSAYSDIAIGCALLLGFSFPLNFDAPYLSSTLQEFWRRWHISLSSWLRDYLYFPLGGSRCGVWRRSYNLIITFLLGGLWHGAGWTFIIWGAIHGVYLAVERCFLITKSKKSVFGRILGTVLVFHVVCAAWILFRAPSIQVVKDIFIGLFNGRGAGEFVTWQVIAMLIVGFCTQLLDGDRVKRLHSCMNALPGVVQGVIVAVVLAVILGLGPIGVAPFIYFQF